LWACIPHMHAHGCANVIDCVKKMKAMVRASAQDI
jgi:hypothetical protein